MTVNDLKKYLCNLPQDAKVKVLNVEYVDVEYIDYSTNIEFEDGHIPNNVFFDTHDNTLYLGDQEG